jgi:beta-galactosidase/beta-glucuronidase
VVALVCGGMGLAETQTQPSSSAGAPRELLLSGDDWRIASFEPGKGVEQRAFAEGFPAGEAMAAIVPGDVHGDLERAGKIPPIFYGTNSQQIGWVAGKEWWYRKTFTLPPSWKGKTVRLRFEAVDYLAEVWLNGRVLGRHEGQFTPFEFDVGDGLRFDGENVLSVQIHAAPETVRKARAGAEWPMMQAMRPAYPYWKSPTNAGWDWGAKIITMGIWKDVRLLAAEGVAMDNPIVLPRLAPPYNRATLEVRLNLKSDKPRAVELDHRVRCLTADEPPSLATQKVDLGAGNGQSVFQMEVAAPRLWWPNGYGEQHLYEMEVTVRAAGQANVLDSARTTFGIRDLKMLANPPAPENTDYGDHSEDRLVIKKMPQPPPELKYLIQINGRKVFARGGNWLPCDLLYGRPRRPFYEHLIRLAAEANYNLFRIWGGGLIEKPEFFELCDRYGIMLFAEFPNAGARLPETEAALAIAGRETREILPLLMNHPSVVRYGGGNEWYRDATNSRQMAQLRAICNEVDPTRPYHDPDPETIAQRHGPHSYYPAFYQEFNTGRPRSIGTDNPIEWTEYGASGASSVETLRSIMPPEALWPIRSDDPYWIWHKAFHAFGADNWMGSAQYRRLFGELPDLETTVRASQFTQAEALRSANQAMRRFRWHRSACACWTYNEPWPNAAHGCIVEYSGRPKMAYYYVKQSYAPVDVLAVYSGLTCEPGKPMAVDIWATQDGLEELRGYKCRYRIFNLRGELCAEKTQTCDLSPESSGKLMSVDWTPPAGLAGEVALLWLELLDPAEKPAAQNLYTFGVVGRSDNLHNVLKVPALSADGRRNLALMPGAKAAASSVIQGYAIHRIARLNDGWYGNSASWIEGRRPSWAEIDLGAARTISRVCVGNDHTCEFTDRGATEFRVLVATEGAEAASAPTWKQLARYKGEPLQGTRTFDFDPIEARWVRIDIVEGADARMDEIEVYEAKPFDGDRAAAEAAAVRGPAPQLQAGAGPSGFLRPLLTAPATALELAISGSERVSRRGAPARVYRAKIRNRSAVPALFVALDVDPVDGLECYLSDSHFTLLSNAEKTVEILLIGEQQSTDGPARLRLRAKAWNAPEASQLLDQPASDAAEETIPYGVAPTGWPEPLGNHRARVRVEQPAEAVWVHLPWRRRDLDPERKQVAVVDLATGKSVANVVRARIHRESGDLVFQPSTVPGEYGVYFLTGKHTGSPYFPNFVYDPPAETPDPAWRERWGLTPAGLASGRWQRLPRARVIEFQARSEFDRFDPMEVLATPDEVRKLLAQHSDRDYLLFPEDRRFPIRMTDELPLRWMTNHDTGRFAGTARPGEFYAFQVGLYAARRPVRDLRIALSDLVSGNGQVIPAAALRCFNLSGTNWLGRQFSKPVSVPEGKVQPLWFGVQVPPRAAPGKYAGSLRFEAGGLADSSVELELTVEGEPLPDAGDGEPWRHSRLRWLDSTVGLDDENGPPYPPIEVTGRPIAVLGRNVTLADTGLPASLSSSFTEAVDSVEGPERQILARPMQFVVETAQGAVAWRGGKPRVTARHTGALSWESQNAGEHFQMLCRAKMDCDGYINYALTLRALRETDLTDARLEIPLRRDVAKYMMGLGCKGGLRPAEWQWRWNADLANHRVWIGDVNAGLHCKLKDTQDTWELYNMKSSGLPESWHNGGRGGCTIAEEGPEVVRVRFYTGARRIEPGRELLFRFGLMATPVKTLNPAHWNWRYWHQRSPLEEVARSGANIINVHHANDLNPFINYPFLAADRLKPYIEQAHQRGIKVKLYYTIRELSNHAAELWALRSLGDEIFRLGPGCRLPDQFVSQSADKGDNTTGHAWLCEHLVTGYVPAWHQKFGPGDWDAALATTGLSRWHNYYLEGMAWLIKNAGVDGLYLDGIGYDREIMKRLRKVMDRTRPGCLIDFHCGNHFSPTYGLNSIVNQHMEHLPYIDSLWLGEGFNYDESPEYWLVELSGIPFGLFGEMLGVGNPWRGMLYGMSNRLPYGGGDPRALWKVWDEFGIQDARMLGYWAKSRPIQTGRNDVLATAYVKPGKTLLALASWAKEDARVRLRIGWHALGMNQQKALLRAPAVPGFQEARTFQPDDEIPVPQKRGWLLVLEQNN